MSTEQQKYLRIAFAGSLIDIIFNSDDAERMLAFLFRDVAKPDKASNIAPAAHFTYRLESDPNTAGLSLYAGEELECERLSAEEMALHLIGQVCYQLAYYSSGGLVMHAALVSCNGLGLLLPGATGRGKSSLVAWLIHNGYDYSTDELVYIPDGRLMGYGFARPLNLKRSARPLLNNFYNISAGTTGTMNNAAIDLIPPELFSKGEVRSHVRICAAILPRFQADGAFECRTLSKAQAGFELMQCLINARNLPEHGFPQVINLARSIPIYQMVYNDFSVVTPKVSSILELSIPPNR